MTTDKTQPSGERIREGFPHQRLVVIPANVHDRCHHLPMLGQLHVTHIGAFPSAEHHYVERETGVPQAILIYCLEGRGFLELDHSTFPIEQGHVAIIPPDTPHIYYADTKEPWSIFWVLFDGKQTLLALQSLGVDARKPLLYVPDVPMMRQAFEDVYACLNYHYSDAGLLSMTSELMRLLSKIKLHHSNPHREQQAVEDRILGTIEFMEQHLDMSVSLDTLAAYAGQSVSHYSKLFKYRTSQSPMACFLQLKIRKACELLDQTNQSVKVIAEELGYDDPYYFSRLFKKIQGCSPTHYRDSIKG